MNIALAIAAGLTLITWGIHTFVGTPLTVGPLLKAKMHPVPKYTNYYCWHMVTLVLLAMAGSFAYAAWTPSGLDVAVLATVMAVSFMVWSLVLVLWKYRKPWHLPQWSLFLAISIAAVIGVV